MFTKWYLVPPRWPTMLYAIVLVCYTAAVLWVLFTAYMCLSLFVYPSLFRAYVGFFLLYGMSLWITGKTTMLSVAFFMSPAKHFTGRGFNPVSLESFAALLSGMVVLSLTVGYLRLRRLQL